MSKSESAGAACMVCGTRGTQPQPRTFYVGAAVMLLPNDDGTWICSNCAPSADDD